MKKSIFRQAPHLIWQGLHQTLQSDRIGGALLLGATVLALVLANTGASGLYESVRDFRFGPEQLHLNLSVGQWASDGLLAIFFFVVGLELKEEFVVGKLRNPRTAALPIAAAVGGVAVPAIIYVIVNASAGAAALRGWAIPAATDIAFAVAILAVVGRFLPPALRVFLLTLAVVDDLLAISIIAIFYTDEVAFVPLLIALVPLGLFALAVNRGVRSIWILLPLGIATWALVHASGIHATVAGVVLGFVVPVIASDRARVRVGTDDDGEPIFDGLAAHFADRWGSLSTGFAVPVFAFFAAGVSVGGVAGLTESLRDTVTLGIIAGLVIGKAIGITGTTFLVTRLPGLSIDPSLKWIDIVGMSFVAGVGFTVSLLVGELSFGVGSESDDHVKVGVLVGSLVAALIGAAMLAVRNRHYRLLGAANVT
ncbi:MAG: Na+/H+ antiporter NhaA [Microbacteriaceae bacterium]